MLNVPTPRLGVRPPQDAAPVVFELPGGVDDRIHLCSVDAVETAHQHGAGTYAALCGDDVLAGSVASRTESKCSACFAHPHRRPGRQARRERAA